MFLESILFLQKLSKSSKIVLPCSGNSVSSRSSCMPQSRAHTEIFQDSLAGQCPNREKYLEYFSKIWDFIFLPAQYVDLFTGGRSSREGYTEIFAPHLETLSWVDFLVAKNT